MDIILDDTVIAATLLHLTNNDDDPASCDEDCSRDMHKHTRNWRLSGYDPKADERTIVTELNTEPRLAVRPAFELEDPWLHDRAGLSNPPLIVGYAHAGPILARSIITLSHEPIFSTIWFAVAAINMWIGVAQADYSFAEELPIFRLIVLVPAPAAIVIK